MEIVLQGAAPRELPTGIVHRSHFPPLRFRPGWIPVLSAAADQARCLLRDLAAVLDFRHTTLTATAIFDVPSLRLWFRTDPPRAVLYANHQIGGEPPVALLDDCVPSAMVFYSANVAYRPRNVNAPDTPLEPEMRSIVADHLTMWSPEMTAGFRTAGYEPGRLVETGPIFFGRQNRFQPTSRYLTGRRDRLTRVGIFDVAVLRPAIRVADGLGLLTYNSDLTRRFFADIFSAASQSFGDDLVVIRKMKRAHHPSFDDDVDFSRLPPVRLEAHDSSESLWRLLEQVDLVLCMPFTSVAYLADECGIPSAYYDPSGEAEPSPLGGRVPLLSNSHQLSNWLRGPAVPLSRVPFRVAPRVLAAATGTLTAADAPHTFWESTEECRSH
jgi:polysaccharide biosynthesis PFTS motif protein